jgi:hypothetical protein
VGNRVYSAFPKVRYPDEPVIEVLVPPVLLPREPGSATKWPEGITPHRDILAFLQYWQGLVKPEGLLPARADISPHDLRSLLPGIIMMDVLPQDDAQIPWRFRYRLVGTEHRHYLNADLTGYYFEDALSPERLPLANESCFSIVRERRPNYLRMSTRGIGIQQRIAYYERVLAPLASDGVTVNMLIGMWHFLPINAAQDFNRRR